MAGFNRKNIFKNISVLRKLFKSVRLARNIIRDFKPDIAIGVGGYASGPTLKAAQRAGVPTLVQEQNSYAWSSATLGDGTRIQGLPRICNSLIDPAPALDTTRSAAA